jgi:hypothetical protein
MDTDRVTSDSPQKRHCGEEQRDDRAVEDRIPNRTEGGEGSGRDVSCHTRARRARQYGATGASRRNSPQSTVHRDVMRRGVIPHEAS